MILDREKLLEKWEFPWSLMDVLIGGKSSIDLDQIRVDSLNDSRMLIKSYGYDLNRKDDKKKLHAIFIEAVYFIEKYLMPKQWRAGNVPPREILQLDDIAKLPLWAANEENEMRAYQIWACAILKVMHTISHIDDFARLDYLNEARTQIMERFEEALFYDKNKNLWFGSKKQAINLEHIEWKYEKSRDSIILKLLHKPRNVAENIYDLLGIRIVTKYQSDVLVAVKYLKQFHLIDFANTHPGRARNTLINMSEFRNNIEVLISLLTTAKISEKSFVKMVQELKAPLENDGSFNPHSSKSYHSIQLTCRQRISYYPKKIDVQKRLIEYLKGKLLSSDTIFVAELTKYLDAHKEDDLRHMFFPFEIQIMDASSYEASQKGEASHEKYKKQQVLTARRRILADILLTKMDN